MASSKTIVVSETTYNTLKGLGKKGDTFDDIIQRLLVTDDR